MSRAGSVTAFAPGRVVLLGEHAEHGAGQALPMAIAQGVTVRATTLPGPLVMARARDLRESDVFDAWRPGGPGDVHGWRAVVRGSAAELAAAGHRVPPARVEAAGTVARTGGFASSAAFGSAVALAMLALAGDEAPDRRRLAWISARVEEHWAGGRFELCDHLTSLLGEDGHALRMDFRHGAIDAVPLPLDGHRLVVAPAGGRRDEAPDLRSERRRECAEAAHRLGVATLADADPAAAAELPEPWASRARHVIDEDRRVADGVAALQAGELGAFGALLDASHASLRDRFHAVGPSVDRTAAAFRAAGAIGVRPLPGRAGGRLLALLPPGAATPRLAVSVAASAGARIS